MLYFTDKGSDIEWHIGEKIPFVRNCSEVQADGKELLFIITHFKNIPYLPVDVQPVQTFTFPWCRFIYDNIPGQRCEEDVHHIYP